jgi:hypothetical protein
LLHRVVKGILGGAKLNFCGFKLLSGETLSLSDSRIDLLEIAEAHPNLVVHRLVGLIQGLPCLSYPVSSSSKPGRGCACIGNYLLTRRSPNGSVRPSLERSRPMHSRRLGQRRGRTHWSFPSTPPAENVFGTRFICGIDCLAQIKFREWETSVESS